MSYQFLPDAVIDVTGFVKNTTGQVVLNTYPEVEIGNTNNVEPSSKYTNGDFGNCERF